MTKRIILIAITCILSLAIPAAGQPPTDTPPPVYSDYVFISTPNLQTVYDVVNYWFERGYEPVGGLATVWNGSEIVYTQAVAKRARGRD